MNPSDINKLVQDTISEITAGRASKIAILGLTDVALELVKQFIHLGIAPSVVAIFTDHQIPKFSPNAIPVLPMQELQNVLPDTLIIASDREKEEIILSAMPYVSGTPKIILAGYAHFEFCDRVLDEIRASLHVPSCATGYKHTLTHIYQCLQNAHRLGLNGIVVEFGMFKGGTTMLMAKVIHALGAPWKIIGFDSFDGFPPRRSPLDMYDHPGCVFTDLESVKRYFTGERVEIIPGDIVTTASRLSDERIVLAFLDTDNFSPASAALKVIRDRVVVGGAIVFDHFTGDQRFRYTLGERLAGKELLADERYFHLHGTGVFYRQR